MITPTVSPKIISRYLDDSEILEGFNDGKKISDLDLHSAIYLHAEGIGLFPVRVRNNIASLHAAIPPSNRGKKAVKAGKMAVNWLKDAGYFVTCRVRKDRPDVMAFAVLCGFERIEENDHYIYYVG